MVSSDKPRASKLNLLEPVDNLMEIKDELGTIRDE
jgi:hypothetical protein